MQNCIACDGPLTGRQKKLCSTRCKNKRLMQSEAWQRAKRKSEADPLARAKKRQREEAAKVERTCEWCGSTWRVKPTRGSRYCSPLCGRSAQLPPPACRIPPGHPALPTWPPALPPGGDRERQCSPDIGAKQVEPRCFTSARCQWCHAYFVALGRYKRVRCSRRCDRAYFAKLRRAQAVRAGYEIVSRAAVFERDRWTCHLCGKAAHRDAQAPYDPHVATLDHVIPLSKGGSHTMENLRTAHFICNSRKGNRLQSDQLILIS